MLVVTDGVDRGSKARWNELRLLAQRRGVAIFGMVQLSNTNVGSAVSRNPENVFKSVCELSGGIVLTASEKSLAGELTEFVDMVRTRYIVEFPHPVDTKGGYHDMNITIDKSDAYVLPSGIGIPVDNAAILHDPDDGADGSRGCAPGRQAQGDDAELGLGLFLWAGGVCHTSGMTRVRGFGLGLCVMLGGMAAGQSVQVPVPQRPAQDDAVPTLHVYTDLVQVPTLVLRKDARPLATPEAEEEVLCELRRGAEVPGDPCAAGGGRSDYAVDSAGFAAAVSAVDGSVWRRGGGAVAGVADGEGPGFDLFGWVQLCAVGGG